MSQIFKNVPVLHHEKNNPMQKCFELNRENILDGFQDRIPTCTKDF